MLTPNRITLMNYGLSKLSKKILRDMLNHKELDYSTMDELIGHYSGRNADDVRQAVEELDGRDFLYRIEKHDREVYAANKLRIANMEFSYDPWGVDDEEE